MAKLGNLASRLLVAVVAVPILLVVIYLDDPLAVWALVFAASIVGMYEFFSMTLEDRADRIASTAAGALAIAVFYWLPAQFADRGLDLVFDQLAVVLAVVPVGLYYLFRFGDMATVARRMAFSITGILYVGFLFTFVALIKRDFGPTGGHFVVFLLATAWLSDTGAYAAGRAFGKRKLYPAVSPKKTWAGAVGAVAAATAAGAVIKVWLVPHLPWVDTVVIAVFGSVLGQLGDLVESVLKRSQGVKDSGAILPGHGGILDRFDAVLAIAPFVYFYIRIRGSFL